MASTHGTFHRCRTRIVDCQPCPTVPASCCCSQLSIISSLKCNCTNAAQAKPHAISEEPDRATPYTYCAATVPAIQLPYQMHAQTGMGRGEEVRAHTKVENIFKMGKWIHCCSPAVRDYTSHNAHMPTGLKSGWTGQFPDITMPHPEMQNNTGLPFYVLQVLQQQDCLA